MTGFNEAIIKVLSLVLEHHKHKPLSKSVCIEIYTDIFSSISEVFKKSNVPLGNESVNYISQQYYDSILINDTHELDPEIFTQRASIKQIPTNELALLAVMLKETDLRIPLLQEIKHRS